MEKKYSVQYTVDTNFPKMPCETQIVRSALLPDNDLVNRFPEHPEADTILKLFRISIKKYPHDKFFGTRPKITHPDGSVSWGEYEWKSRT